MELKHVIVTEMLLLSFLFQQHDSQCRIIYINRAKFNRSSRDFNI